jgi:integrase
LAHAVARLFAPSGEALAQQWLDSMAEQRFATRRRRAATLRTIAYWGARYGIGPVEGFSKLLVTTTERAVPTEETFQKMLNATSGPRDRAILHLVALGLSRSEIVGLRIGDYDREKKTLSSRVRRREKLVQVSGRASSTLEEWLDVDVSGESETTAPIFHGGHRRVPLVVSSVANIFKRISAKAGVSVKPGELRRVAQCR